MAKTLFRWPRQLVIIQQHRQSHRCSSASSTSISSSSAMSVHASDTLRVIQGVILVAAHLTLTVSSPSIHSETDISGSEISTLSASTSVVTSSPIPSQTSSSSSSSNTQIPTSTPDVLPPPSLPLPPLQTNEQWPGSYRESRVPATPAARLIKFSGLAAKLLASSASDVLLGRRSVTGVGSENSFFLSEQQASILASTLCRMRGAALKIGQLLSLQDETLVPPVLRDALSASRQGADIMPQSQLLKLMEKELGEDWRTRYIAEFIATPIAAASIGQVHRAIMHNGQEVAMKVQYPGVAQSIQSDLKNLHRLNSFTNFLPPGLFIDNIIEFAGSELSLECDYIREAECQNRFRSLLTPTSRKGIFPPSGLNASDGSCSFYVPQVISELSTSMILSTEFVRGLTIDKAALDLNLGERNTLARQMLVLTMRELFEFRFMQTDPNWGNFLYDPNRRQLNLIDFGAAREYDEQFILKYLKMIEACARGNDKDIISASLSLGLLTGDESQLMMSTHVAASKVIGEPFATSNPYNFAETNLSQRVASLSSIMLKHRLKAPPREVYSLHRRLSGAYLACIKLRASIRCDDILNHVLDYYRNNLKRI